MKIGNRIADASWLMPFLIFAGCGTQGTREFYMGNRAMEPTIPEASSVLGDLHAYDRSDPERFDIVLFHPPVSEAEHEVWAFRVLGLPGEEVEINENGVHIDSTIIELPSDLTFVPDGLPPWANSPTTLGPNEFFVLGDNTERSLDSRFWGPLPRANIIGKVIKIQQTVGGNSERLPPLSIPRR